MNKRKTALISVWDKSNIVDFAKFLISNDFEIVSTGGTKKILKENNVNVVSISDLTKQDEVMNGRVKTLHPKVFSGILADRDNEHHMNDLQQIGSRTIDLVVVNLYPFKEEAIDKQLDFLKAIEFIDIGGPSMLRAAAKNYKDVICIADPNLYNHFIESYKNNNGDIPIEERLNYAKKIFQLTSKYDFEIFNFFNKDSDQMLLSLSKVDNLRYGENPHQNAAFYLEDNKSKNWNQSHGKSLSYNNYYDIETAISIVSEFDELSCVIIKHSNPCGFAVGQNLKEAYLSAVSTDPVSFFGGIVGFNRCVDQDVAIEINKSFLECIVAPKFSDESISILSKKKNLRLISMENMIQQKYMIKSVFNGFLIQDKDNVKDCIDDFEVVSKIKPNNNELKALYLSWKLVKYVKSNAIVFSNDIQLIGVGAGQMSRVDSVKIAISKANENKLNLKGSVMASDAFFPFSDCITLAAKEGISGVIQPGGSIKDAEVIKEVDKQKMFMVITNKRHFNH